MLFGILLLATIVFGISILFGRGKPETFGKFLIWLIFAPTLLAVGYNQALWFWSDIPLGVQILSIVAVPFFVAAFLHLIFPQAKWLHNLQAIVFQTLIYLAAFPFRFLWRAGRLIFQRERRTERLSPYPPFVGGSAPLAGQGDTSENRNNTFDR